MIPLKIIKLVSIRLSVIISSVAVIMLLAISLWSCSKYAYVDCETYDYSNCIEDEPFSGNMEINVSITPAQPEVTIVIYEGYFPEQKVVMTHTLLTSKRNISLPIGKHYAVTASYVRDGKTIIAVDGDKITKKSYNVCDAVCWEVKEGKVDLRLVSN